MHIGIMRVLLLLVLAVTRVASLVLFTRSDIFGAFQVKLFNPNDLISSTSNKRFEFPNTYYYQSISIIGLAFNGYQSPSLNLISFTAEPTYSYTNNSIIITLIEAAGSSFNLVTYSIILISSTATANSLLDLQNPCFTPSKTTVSTASLNYGQSFSFTTAFNKTNSNNIQVAAYLRSISSSIVLGYNYFNLTQFSQTGTFVRFSINVSYSVVQSFCLSVLSVHLTNLQGYSNYNASYVSGVIDSTNPLLTLASVTAKSFGTLQVYGPVLDQKCVVGLLNFQLSNKNNQSFFFDLTVSPMSNVTASASYYLQYSVLCFVQLQCQYLYQTYYVMINDCQGACKISNCLTCTTATSCSNCSVSYFVDGMLRCSSCIPNCANCSSTTTCITCNGGYYYNSTSQQCIACALNCLTCTASSCSVCMPGYYVNNTNCYSCQGPMPNCATCSTSSMCSTCQSGFYFGPSQGSCISCTSIANCKICSSASSCTLCQPGFYLPTPQRCIACVASVASCCVQYVPNCVMCSSSTNCSACNSGYFFAPNATVFNNCIACGQLLPNCQVCVSNTNCTQCLTGWYLQPNSSVCIPCATPIPNCMGCYSASICFLCDTSFAVVNGKCQQCGNGIGSDQYYVQNNICTLCNNGVQNCYRCSSSTACIECQSGYYNNNGACVPCGSIIQNCIVCDNSTVCLACSFGNFLNNTQCISCATVIPGCVQCTYNSYLQCNGCSQQTFMSATGTCTSCLTSTNHCQKCSDLNSCNLCVPGYFLSQGMCQICQGANCLTCSSQYTCSQCPRGFYLTLQNGCNNCSVLFPNCLSCNLTWCYACNTGNFRGPNGTCLNCFTAIPNCITCSNSSTCVSCLTNYYLTPNNTCLQCPASLTNCLACSSKSSCSTCLNFYFLSTNSLCLSCSIYIPKCQICINATTCLGCEAGYYVGAVNSSANATNPRNITNNCSICMVFIANCQSCLNQTFCQTCNSQYFASSQSRCSLCANYIPNCITCSSAYICTSCISGYMVDTNGQCVSCVPSILNCLACANPNTPYLCGNCADGYYLASNSCFNCASAISFCATCPTPSLCLTCIAGYYPANSNQQCLPCITPCSVCSNYNTCLSCLPTFFLNNTTGACANCPTNCLTCNSSQFCQTCSKTYFLNSQRQCSSCSAVDTGCLVCSNSTLCTIYAVQSDSTTYTVSIWAYLAIAGAGLLGLIVLVTLACCIWRNFCKSQQGEKEMKQSVVGVTERQMVISSKPGEKDFQIEHNGMCKLCGEGKLEVMNIELLCYKCEGSMSEDLTDHTRPIRKEIVFSSNHPTNQRETD